MPARLDPIEVVRKAACEVLKLECNEQGFITNPRDAHRIAAITTDVESVVYQDEAQRRSGAVTAIQQQVVQPSILFQVSGNVWEQTARDGWDTAYQIRVAIRAGSQAEVQDTDKEMLGQMLATRRVQLTDGLFDERGTLNNVHVYARSRTYQVAT